MEGVAMTASARVAAFHDAFRDARVLITGHTGFKGSWLSEWLLALGAEVTGFALEPTSEPSLFTQLGLAKRLRHVVGDVRCPDAVRRVIDDTRPAFVFHLAAQPLVRRSYRDAAYTWETNVVGTVNVLEALRSLTEPCAAVMVTTDKCYENHGANVPYREGDPLGGHDPYSSSKAAAEVAVASWRRSFFLTGHPVRIATARAGNVIGGGDWAEDRIVPDLVRSIACGERVRVRNPHATRPWQHVLEPTSGYMAIATALSRSPDDDRLVSAFNIGPGHEANQPVSCLVEAALEHWPGTWAADANPGAPHEAALLQLDSEKIRALVGWRPTWNFPKAVGRTIAWYRDTARPGSCTAADRTIEDIQEYQASAFLQRIPWATAASDRPASNVDA